MNTTGWAVIILSLIIILGAGWWFVNGQPPAATTTDVTGTAAGTVPAGSQMPDNGMVGGDADVSGSATTGTTIRYSAAGFNPQNVTISAGQKVTFISDGVSPMWVASDEHPTHTDFDGSDRSTHCSGTYAGPTPFDQCQAGTTYTYVFTKAGTFDYHNHEESDFGGTITVR